MYIHEISSLQPQKGSRSPNGQQGEDFLWGKNKKMERERRKIEFLSYYREEKDTFPL